MPQLDPNPWFAVLVFSWIVFLTVIPTKILSTLTPNEPTPMSKEGHKANAWTWPW